MLNNASIAGTYLAASMFACINIQRNTNCIKCGWKLLNQCITDGIFLREMEEI